MADCVLVGGGTGFIGAALCRALRNVGYTVYTVSRKAQSPDMISWSSVKEDGLPLNCKAVINTAGEGMFSAKKRWTEEFKEVVVSSRLSTTSILRDAINKADRKPDVFVSLSGVGIYKASETEEYTEDTPGWDGDFISKLVTDWEQASGLNQPDCADVRRVIIRTGVVLARHGGVLGGLYYPFYLGLGGPTGSGKQFFPWIHLTDMVQLILFSIQNPKVNGILNAVAPQVISNREFATAFGNALWRPSFLTVPEFLLNRIMGEERAQILLKGQKVLPKRVLDYGFTYEYPDITSACKECAHLFYTADQQ